MRARISHHLDPVAAGPPAPATAPARRRRRSRGAAAGFTLIELIIVVAIIGILATIAVPALRNAPLRAKESVLREDLFSIRSCIDQHLADRGQYPTSLADLVEKGYLRAIPVDPLTKVAEWTEVPTEAAAEEELQPTEDEQPTINDVHSKAPGLGLDGTPYAEW
jgi:general secretion pathway protein G